MSKSPHLSKGNHAFEPQIKPLKSAPSLFTLNGCGLAMYGRRNVDPETRAYTKTRCICLIFIPIFAVDAYRVIDAPTGGWYFMHREKLSGFAKGFRSILLLMAVVGISLSFWNSYRESPEYRIKKADEEGAKWVAKGQPMEAVQVYDRMLRQRVGPGLHWISAMGALLRAEIDSGEVNRIVAALKFADRQRMLSDGPGTPLAGLSKIALTASEKFKDPGDVYRILSSFKPEPSELGNVHEPMLKALEALHQKQPGDPKVSVELALMREEFGQTDGAMELLQGAENLLGNGEGARLYGQLLQQADRSNEALKYLEAYVEPRMKEWQRVSGQLKSTYTAAQNAALQDLDATGGPPGFRAKYEAASRVQQEQMVREHVLDVVEKNLGVQQARSRYQEQAQVIPAIMSLGITYLRCAQAESEPEMRKKLLGQAEKTLLSLKGVADDQQDFQFFLGQVYFWSNRDEEGRQQFEQLLKSTNRGCETLYSLAQVYRELGDENETRKLLDEAFSKATQDVQKNAIVRLRAMHTDSIEEKIAWLSKGTSSDPLLAINLSEARGEKAEQAGALEDAARFYREALTGYEKQPSSASSLNNSAILYKSLYGLEGKQEDIEKSASMFSSALELQPASSILSFNCAESLMTAAVLRVVGDRVDPKFLKLEAGLGGLQLLYNNEAEKKAIAAALKSEPNYQKAIARFWEALLLSPKNLSLYAWGTGVFSFTQDKDSLEKLKDKVVGQQFDFSLQKQQREDYQKGKRDEEVKASIAGNRERLNKLKKELSDPRSLALAGVVADSAQFARFAIGEESGASQALPGLRDVVKRYPCSMTRGSLVSASSYAALEQLMKDDAECRAMVEANRRFLGVDGMLGLLIRADGALGEKVRRHPLVVAMRQDSLDLEKDFPSTLSYRDWAILEGFQPAEDQVLRERLKANWLEPITSTIADKVSPESPSIWIERYWRALAEGREEEANGWLKKMEGEGLKLPKMK